MDTKPNDPAQLRRNLLRIVLRQAFTGSGVPAGWIQTAIARSRGDGERVMFQLRMQVHCLEPRLLAHLGALQQDLERRLLDIAPDAPQWFDGITWRLVPPADEGVWPLPGPEFWDHVAHERQERAAAEGRVGAERQQLDRRFRTADDLDGTDPDSTDTFDPTQPSPLE